MNTSKLKLFVGFIAVVLLLPNVSLAYFTTNQSATFITERTVLYTVTYKFGFANRGLYMPIGALRSSESESPYLEYAILNDEDSPTEAGTAAGFVFTSDKDVEILDNQYYLEPGESAKFTLVALYTIPETELDNNEDFSLLVTSLPFTMIVDDNPVPAQLNPSELQYYRTPEVGL